jgi:transposase InsO family protein
MLNKNNKDGLIKQTKISLINHMQVKAQIQLNPYKYHLSLEAKKRLRWMYILYYEQDANITKAANKIGVSRQWLSGIKSEFEKNNKNPRSLEPKSKTPLSTKNRNRIDKSIEDKIIKIRSDHFWGKDKIEAHLRDHYNIKVNHNTINKYLHLHKMINPKISLKNTNAMKNKKAREVSLQAKFRPPKKLKDLYPGALVEKDMKYLPKPGKNRLYDKERDFWYQQTCIDSFTRIRTLEVTEDFKSKTVTLAYQKAQERMPFNVACINVDNGSENQGEFSKYLQATNVFQFYSNISTPTDNPRVERSHLSDDVEFYNRGNIYNYFKQQIMATSYREYEYNYLRPHQALGQMTPMAFYELWKENPEKAIEITEKWQKYLKKQSIRLSEARRIKKREQIDALMNFIDAKINNKNNLYDAKLQLINCQLCSMA